MDPDIWRPRRKGEGKGKKAKTLENEARMLVELGLDFDWEAARKRVGISKHQLERMKQCDDFRAKADKVMTKAMTELSSGEKTVKRFRATQDKLTELLDMGETSVASSLMKSHEMEFKMHGLFERDNRQKSTPVNIAISLYNEPEPIEAEVIEENENGEEL